MFTHSQNVICFLVSSCYPLIYNDTIYSKAFKPEEDKCKNLF